MTKIETCIQINTMTATSNSGMKHLTQTINQSIMPTPSSNKRLREPVSTGVATNKPTRASLKPRSYLILMPKIEKSVRTAKASKECNGAQ